MYIIYSYEENVIGVQLEKSTNKDHRSWETVDLQNVGLRLKIQQGRIDALQQELANVQIPKMFEVEEDDEMFHMTIGIRRELIDRPNILGFLSNKMASMILKDLEKRRK